MYVLPRSWVRFLGWLLLIVVAVVAGRLLLVPQLEVALVSPVAGVAPLWVFTMRTRRKATAALVITTVLVLVLNLATGSSPSVSVLLAASMSVHVIVAVTILRRGLSRNLDMERLSDGMRILAAAVGASAAAALVTGAGALAIADFDAVSGMAVIFLRNLAATALIIGGVAGLRTPARSSRTGFGLVEPTAMLMATVVACWATMYAAGRLPLLFIVLLVTVWSGLRLGIRWTIAHVGTVAAITTAAATGGRGPTAAIDSWIAMVFVVQSFSLVVLLIGTGTALLQAERAAALGRELRARKALAASIDNSLIGQATVVFGAGGHHKTDAAAPARTAVIVESNPALSLLLGRPPEQLADVPFVDLVVTRDRAEAAAALAAIAAGERSRWTGELELDATSGTCWVEVAAVVVPELDPRRHVLMQFLDVTERRLVEAKLERMALSDALTGLPNRMLLHDRITHALATAERDASGVAVLFIDLDGFKQINDSLGHRNGDLLLTAMAQRLTDTIRPGDTAARLGGDEFVVLYSSVQTLNQVQAMAERVQQALQLPIELDGERIVVSLSGGLALSRTGDDSEALLARADTAMYEAKNRGRGRIETFDQEVRARASRNLRLTSHLATAIDDQQFVVHYQPIVDLDTERMMGAEALVRWQHPQRGLLLPDEWLDVAEHRGLLVPLGGWILRQACDQAASMKGSDPPITMQVNVSVDQLRQPTLFPEVLDALTSSGLAAEQLTLELTETGFIDINPSLLRDLDQLRQMGVRFAMDDLGTGFSTLSQLVDLPVDELKIDQRFVAHIQHDPRSQAVIRAILGMADALELSVVAEGVETAQQAKTLREMGCRSAQGHLWSPARPALDRRWRPATATNGADPAIDAT